MLHPDFMIQIENARLQDIRNVEAAHRAAKLAKGDQPNQIQAKIKGFVTFLKEMTIHNIDATQSSSPITQVGKEQG